MRARTESNDDDEDDIDDDDEEEETSSGKIDRDAVGFVTRRLFELTSSASDPW